MPDETSRTPLRRACSWLARPVRRLQARVRPRLGKLYQHAPRAYRLPRENDPAYRAPSPLSISIVTPSYMQSQFLGRTMDSVLAQGYPRLEYFVQDGGSRDGTPELLESHEHRLSGWASERDSGQSQAINRGFSRTTGEIMAWLNSDDILLPGALHRVADIFATMPDVDVVYGHRILVDSDDRLIGRWILPPHDDDILSWVDFVPQETLFWRRSAWDRAGGQIDESFDFAMDWDLILRFRQTGARFYRAPFLIGAFRVHEQQKTSAAISSTGYAEMDRLRLRELGFVPSYHQIRRASMSYVLRHVAIDALWGLRTRPFGRL